MNQRPTGVTILAILAFIGGAFGVLGGLALFGVGAIFAGYTGGGLAFIFGILLVALSILELWIGYGFWTLKRSAWSLALVVFGASLIIQFVEIPLGYNSFSSFVVSLVIYGIILYYLLSPGVKAAFGVTGDIQTAVMSGLPMGGGAAASTVAPAAPAAQAEPPAASPLVAPAPTSWSPPSEPAASEPPTSSWSPPSAPAEGTGSSDAGDGGEDESA